MSRDTVYQHAPLSQAQAAGPNHDLEAEHDAERARRISTALLRQEASKTKRSKQDDSEPASQEAELTVSVGVVNLGSGSPRDQIQEHVDTIVHAWNSMLLNLTGAVAQFVNTVQHSQVREAEPGLIAALWAKAEPLLARAAAYVTGTTLGATLGLEAVRRIVAYGDALEQMRVQADKTAFIDQVYAVEEALKQRGPFEGGSHDLVSALDHQFISIGKSNTEDAYKPGDRGVVGAQASFLKDLQRRAEEYRNRIPKKPEFVGKFLQEWVSFHHKKRKRSALRSPFEGATYQDGYIELKTRLHYDSAYSGWFVAHGSLATAVLHCPNSREVAHTLQQTVEPFNLDQLDVPIMIELHAADSAWEHMPAHWKNQRDRRVHIRNGMVTSGARDYWHWVMQQTGTSTREVLAGVTTLQG